MAFELTRSTLGLGEAANLIIGASLGIENVSHAMASSSAASNVSSPSLAAVVAASSGGKCTCKGSPTPPPCYSCTFHLEHSPPPYPAGHSNKSIRLMTTRESSDDHSRTDSQSNCVTHLCSNCEEGTTGPTSNVDIHLHDAPAGKNITSNNMNDGDIQSTHSCHAANLSYHSTRPSESSGELSSCRGGARPKMLCRKIRSENFRSPDSRRLHSTIPESDVSNEVEDRSNWEGNSGDSFDMIGRISPVRERLGSVSAYKSSSVDSSEDREDAFPTPARLSTAGGSPANVASEQENPLVVTSTHENLSSDTQLMTESVDVSSEEDPRPSHIEESQNLLHNENQKVIANHPFPWDDNLPSGSNHDVPSNTNSDAASAADLDEGPLPSVMVIPQ